MQDNIPTVREIAWASLVPQLLVGAVLIGGAGLLFRERSTALFVGAGAYLVLSRGLKAAMASHQSRGVKLLRAGRYEEAIAEFETSYRFFSKYPWLDRWRYVTLLSSSAYSYRELALCNIAFAQLHRKQLADAVQTYRRTLAEFPGCAMARISLETIEAARLSGGG